MRAGRLLPLAALLAWLAGGLAAASLGGSGYPPPSALRSTAASASWDMGALAFGARRLFADLWFVRLMQYYGTPEIPEDGHDEASCAEPGHHHHHYGLNGEGRYPLFLPISLHVLQLDPYFGAAALYSAGSLAFNMNRPADAEAVLRFALAYDQRAWKHLNLLAAIGYSRSGDPAAVAAALAPMLKDPDCPVMLKQQAAFLNKRIGNYAAAAAIYADIAATSRDQAYVANARRELQKLASAAGGRP